MRFVGSRGGEFVAHSNCQHQLENTFYGNMFCIRDFEGWQRLQFFLIFTPLLPVLYITYLFLPNLKVGQLLRCPIIKFIGHMLSYFTFLLLITVATFRLDKDNDEVENPDLWKVRAFQIWSYDFRNSQQVMTKIHILLLFWIVGRLWWAPDDPEYVSDCLFALANVLSFARVSYLMPAWELLGPLQISLARMVSDIIRFLTLFSVAHLTRVKCNIMRRYLFQLQKQKEAENKSGDLAMLNIQRQQQQQQEFRVASLSPTVMSKERASISEYEHSDLLAAHANRAEEGEIRKPTDTSVGESQSSGAVASASDKRLREAQYARFLTKSCTHGVSSLLMPPSVRRKLKAVAEIQRHADTNTLACSQDAEAALRFLLFETTRRPMKAPNLTPFSPHPGQSFNPDSFDSQFTARIERPLKHTHLRELYKVEQEMHDMSDALSSISFTNSTMSEVDELEALPTENIYNFVLTNSAISKFF
ncbi:Short transient receptor potential channel 2 [Taenia crassiceps]|uniref:Short transient receptor potential channel 2 n=1 Tax=Taenia crassiceps TaxID=6207 RepID=A0ABR4QFG8_9CEST